MYMRVIKWIPKKKGECTVLKTHDRNVAKVISCGVASSAGKCIYSDLKRNVFRVLVGTATKGEKRCIRV